MSKHYDNWERLVVAVLRRQHDREIALCHSIDSSTLGSRSSSFSSEFYEQLPEPMYGSPSTTRYLEDGRNKEKKSCMVGAKELVIIWCGDTPWYWDLVSHPDSRFSEVAELKSVCWLEIVGTVNTRKLSSNTIYGAYLVFKLRENSYGLESAYAFVKFTDDKVNGENEREAIIHHLGQEIRRVRGQQSGEVPVRMGDGLAEIVMVHLQPPDGSSEQQTGCVGVRRSDGWMEIEMGSFYIGKGGEGDVEARLMEIHSTHWKSGLIVEGIEFRPKA